MSELKKRIADLSPEKQALLAQRMRKGGPQLPVHEPLAIVGMACRFPGDGDSLDGFWRMLASRRDAVSDVPGDRWDGPGMFDTDLTRPGKISSRWGTWLHRLDEFDAQFFGIAPREAGCADPQQRIVLEVSWEAFEDAGITMETLAGSRTGVYIGTHVNDFSWMNFGDLASIDAYAGTGTAHSIVANRVSYIFDLRGPSLAVDTACSSSLTAVHLACQGLRAGDCDIAVAGGVNLMLSPHWAIAVSKLGMLSPDGRCKTFDARANGIVRGEGCGVVILKRLSDAIRGGDRIWAIIRGSAANQDGRTNGLTAPNGLAQKAALRAALENAGVSPGEISAVEAHGTGTALGDPIEVEALSEVLGMGDPARNPCMLGSVKTNIGHLEGAAGIAGFIRLALSLHHEMWPGLVNFETLNPHISLTGTRFVIGGENRPWPRGSAPRYGGVSAFGFGGTNVHVVVGEAPAPSTTLATQAQVEHSRIFVLPLSARSPGALRTRAGEIRDLLRERETVPDLYDLCYTAAFRRSLHEYGVGVTGRNREEIAGRLDLFASGAYPFGVFAGKRHPHRPPGLAFIFSGQGSQWVRMGRGLARSEAVVGEILEHCEDLIRALAGWSLAEELERSQGESRLQNTEFAQPAIFAIQVAIAAWLEAQGIRPEAVAGHSVGEVAAAYVAGLLSLPDAVRVVVERAKLMQRGAGRGKMLSVERPAAELESIIDAGGGALAIAAVNSPTSCVISGDIGAVEDAAAELESQGAAVRFLPVDYAFHSRQMEPYALELEGVLAGVRTASPKVPFVSTVTGISGGADAGTASYWRRNVRQQVRFADAIEELARLGCRTFLEVGPHAVLTRALKQCVDVLDLDGAVVGTLFRGQDEDIALATTVNALHLLGYRPNRSRYFPGKGRVVALPSYPWQREKYPIGKTGKMRSLRIGAGGYTGSKHPFLGRKLDTGVEIYESLLGPDGPAWLAEHRIHGHATVPAAVLIGYGVSAAESVFGPGGHAVENLVIEKPIVVPEGEEYAVHIAITREAADAAVMRVFSRSASAQGDGWSVHATAQLTMRTSERQTMPMAEYGMEKIHDGCGREVPPDEFYANLGTLGADFGKSFRTVVRLRVDRDSASGVVEGAAGAEADGSPPIFLPGLIDGSLQVAGAMLHDPDIGAGIHLPVSIRSVRVYRAVVGPVQIRSERRPGSSGKEAVVDVVVRNLAGDLALELEGIHFRAGDRLRTLTTVDKCRAGPACYAVEWRPLADESQRVAGDPSFGGSSWLILGDPDGLGSALSEALEARGAQVVLGTPGERWSIGGPRRYTLDCHNGSDIRKLLGEGRPGGSEWTGVVHFLAVPEEKTAESGVKSMPQRAWNGTTTFLETVQAVAGLANATHPRLFAVTRGAQPGECDGHDVDPGQTPIWGLARVVSLEHPELSCKCIDLDRSPTADDINNVINELGRNGAEEVAYRKGVRHGIRLASVEGYRAQAGPERRLEKGSNAVLDDLKWIPIERRAPAAGELELRVIASGLNFRDVLNALGMYPGDPVPLGNECVGEVLRIGEGVGHLVAGDIAMGVAFGSIATHVTASAALFVKVPSAISLAEAASVPIAFLTAHCALSEIAHLKRGERVLIHAATGGVGLAAVRLALSGGAEVVATAGSPGKRAFLRRIGIEHVFDSRAPDFNEKIAASLGRQCVHVVLNSLTGEFIPKSLDLLAQGGRFVEIGKRGIWRSEDVAKVRPDVRYDVLYLGEICVEEPERVSRMLNGLASRIDDGSLKPLPTTAYRPERAVEAFRFMAQAKHIGKIVVAFPEAFTARALPETAAIRPDATYLVTGGCGGLGLAVSEALVDRGARSLVLTGRTAPSQSAASTLANLRQKGAAVHVVQADVADLKGMRRVFDLIEGGLPPLKGIVHAAGVTDDGPLMEQDGARFAGVMAPKVAGAWNLHLLSVGSKLDFFILFSSIASLLGWPGQGGYAAGNAFLEGIAHYRRARGLPALSINWGPWGEAGMAASLSGPHQERLRRWGLNSMSRSAGVHVFMKTLGIATSQVAALDVDWRVFAEACGNERLRRLATEMGASKDVEPVRAMQAQRSFQGELAETPPAKRRVLVQTRIRSLAVKTLGLAATFDLDPRQGLRDVGLDSLMAVELRNALSRMAGISLPSTLLFDYPTVEALTGYLLQQVSTGREQEPGSDNRGTRGQSVAPGHEEELRDLSEGEAEELLRKELSQLNQRPRTER